MYKKTKPATTGLKVNKSYEGETIENKINRIVNNKEPIKDGAPLIYTERKDGVQPQYDIRTDRFEIAIDAMTQVEGAYQAQREHRIGEKTYDTMTTEQQEAFHKKYPNNKHNKQKPTQPDGGTEPAQGTDKKPN